MKQCNWPVTFSIGVVTFQHPPESVEEIIGAADKAMYAAKKSGKGQLVMRAAE
jgi:diguanylate cyclase (GGDEF)-like protein